MELLDAVHHQGPLETCWSRWVNVPRVALQGSLPWYKTIVGAATDEEELCGVLAAAGSGTNSLNVEFYVVVEFKGPIATANTPMMVEFARQMREARLAAHAVRKRAALLATLGSAPTVNATKV